MDKIYIVMDYVEHDLKSLMENMKEPFLIGEVFVALKIDCFLWNLSRHELLLFPRSNPYEEDDWSYHSLVNSY